MNDESHFSQLAFDRWTVIIALCGLLFLLSLRSIWRSAAHSRKAKIFWSFICVIPLLGPTAWFATGIQRQKHR
jgi:magnesium-transporting ATPase (P-type)